MTVTKVILICDECGAEVSNEQWEGDPGVARPTPRNVRSYARRALRWRTSGARKPGLRDLCRPCVEKERR